VVVAAAARTTSIFVWGWEDTILVRMLENIATAAVAKVARTSTAWFDAKKSCKFVDQWAHCGLKLCHLYVQWV
jgi:hypothetical protein